MKTKVVTVSVEASAAGKTLSVTGAIISLGVNAIPSIELQCAPSDDGSNTPLEPNVKKPKISDFDKLYSSLSKSTIGLQESGNVSIKIKDSEGKSDSIDLKDWKLAGVGLSSVSATSAPYLSVVLNHPICMLTKLGSIYETPKALINKKIDEVAKEGSDFIGIMESVHDFVKSADEYFWPVNKSLASDFRHKLGNSGYRPSDYLESSKELFLAHAAGDEAKPRIAQAIGRMVLGGYGASSIWDVLVGASGSLLLSITQDQTRNFTKKKLIIEPTMPWKKSSITLKDEECFWTELPGSNPFRLAGVMARKMGPYNDSTSLGLMRNGNPLNNNPVNEFLYAPENNSVDAADGCIMKTSAPSVIDAAFRRDAPFGGTISQGMVDLTKVRQDGYDKVLEKYCQAVYEISLLSMVRAKAQMALWFKDGDGNLILPGNTCKFVSDGKTIYYGYIQNVVHNLSTSGGCSTTISMSRVRAEELPDEVKSEKNAAYE